MRPDATFHGSCESCTEHPPVGRTDDGQYLCSRCLVIDFLHAQAKEIEAGRAAMRQRGDRDRESAAYDYEKQMWVTGCDADALRQKQAREELEIINDPGYWRDLLGLTPAQRDARAADLIAKAGQ